MNSLAQLRPRILYLLQVLLYLEIWQQQSSSRNLQKPHEYICRKLAHIHVPKFWLDTHGYHIYPKPGDSRVHTCILQFSNQIIQKARTFNQNYSEEKHVWAHTHKQFETRENLTEKQKVTRVSRTKNLAVNLVTLVRIPPNFLYKSRVLHLECTPTGVYAGKGGPRSSHFLLF